jgi:hypothetical protein
MHWVMLLLAVTSSFLGLTCRSFFLQDTVQDYLGLIEDFAARLKKLSSEGMNTSEAEKFIKNALLLLGKEDLTEEEVAWIQSNLTAADQELRRLEGEFQSYMFWKTAGVAARVTLLLSIPVITYVFLPRLWAYVWFKTRRKWIVRKKGTD